MDAALRKAEKDNILEITVEDLLYVYLLPKYKSKQGNQTLEDASYL